MKYEINIDVDETKFAEMAEKYLDSEYKYQFVE